MPLYVRAVLVATSDPPVTSVFLDISKTARILLPVLNVQVCVFRAVLRRTVMRAPPDTLAQHVVLVLLDLRQMEPHLPFARKTLENHMISSKLTFKIFNYNYF